MRISAHALIGVRHGDLRLPRRRVTAIGVCESCPRAAEPGSDRCLRARPRPGEPSASGDAWRRSRTWEARFTEEPDFSTQPMRWTPSARVQDGVQGRRDDVAGPQTRHPDAQVAELVVVGGLGDHHVGVDVDQRHHLAWLQDRLAPARWGRRPGSGPPSALLAALARDSSLIARSRPISND